MPEDCPVTWGGCTQLSPSLADDPDQLNCQVNESANIDPDTGIFVGLDHRNDDGLLRFGTRNLGQYNH